MRLISESAKRELRDLAETAENQHLRKSATDLLGHYQFWADVQERQERRRLIQCHEQSARDATAAGKPDLAAHFTELAAQLKALEQAREADR